MNLKLSKADFHNLIMLYLIDLTNSTKKLDGEVPIVSEEFGEFLAHIGSRSFGHFVLMKRTAEQDDKINLNKVKTALAAKNEVNILI